MGKEKKENPDKVGLVKFWAWQTSGISASANFIILGFVTIYCTDTLKIPPALVGTLLMITKLADGVTDLFAGYLVDRTKTRFGKGRTYEFAILGAWLCTWLLYSSSGEASLFVKCIWVASMYSCISAIFMTLLQASNNAYFVRSFATNGQRVKIASFGGIVIMLGAVALSTVFPILMNRPGIENPPVSVYREAADPSLVLFKGLYYLFPSMTAGFLVSEDLIKWRHHELGGNIPVCDYAPDVRPVGEYLYFSASKAGENCSFFRSKDPLHEPFEEIKGIFSFWDPNLFFDDDGRLYFYWGCSNVTPIYGVELDAQTLRPQSQPLELFGSDNTRTVLRSALRRLAHRHRHTRLCETGLDAAVLRKTGSGFLRGRG